jgi:RHH-type proline utilization regulon transcriptional repressor/proline dehydrogenase/delta 1-pyrroline-5-carboxylate dehydrogenase
LPKAPGARGPGEGGHQTPAALASLEEWARAQRNVKLSTACKEFGRMSPDAGGLELPGPTGERNVYSLAPRDAVLCLAGDDTDRLVQLSAVLAVRSHAIWPMQGKALLDTLPADVRARVTLVSEPLSSPVPFDAVLLHGTQAWLHEVQKTLARRKGPVISVERLGEGDVGIPLERLVVERSLSINTAAAGGNASLMTLG